MEENRLTDLKGTVESGLLYVEWCVRVCMCRLMPVHISVMVWGNTHTGGSLCIQTRTDCADFTLTDCTVTVVHKGKHTVSKSKALIM